MKKKIRKLVLIIVIALTIIITGGVVAYLTDTDNATNTFTVGSVSIDLTEDNWDEVNGQNVTPGKVIAKDPAIKNTGKNPAYVYLKVEVPCVYTTDGAETSGPFLSYSVNSGWTVFSTNNGKPPKTSIGAPMTCSIAKNIYYYNTVLASGETTTTLFDSVTISNFRPNSDDTSQDVVITAYAIQSDGLPSGTTIQSAYNTYFKN